MKISDCTCRIEQNEKIQIHKYEDGWWLLKKEKGNKNYKSEKTISGSIKTKPQINQETVIARKY